MGDSTIQKTSKRANNLFDVRQAEDERPLHRGSPDIQNMSLTSKTQLNVSSLTPTTILQLQRVIGNQNSIELLNTVQKKSHSVNIAQVIQRAENAPQSFDVRYPVQLIPQLSNMSCWAASAAMLVSWRDSISISDMTIAEVSNAMPQYKLGLDADDASIFPIWGLEAVPPQSYTVNGFRDMLTTYGPIWFASNPDSPHARVITGIFTAHFMMNKPLIHV